MDDNAPDKIKSYHDEAFRFINQALTLDEKGDTKNAFLLYHKGLRQLILGSNVPCKGAGPKFDRARKLQEKMKLTKDQVEERVASLQSASADTIPQKSPPVENEVEHQSLSTASQGALWEDVNELLVLEDGVKMFFVSELGNVTTIAQPQTLRAYQFVKYEEGCSQPPAFLQCSGWMFPMVPKRSPVLNTEPHTYMFPDIPINLNNPAPQRRPQKAFASVGLIINPHITTKELKRFERILECYTDFNRYTPTAKEYQELAQDQNGSGPISSSTHVGEGSSAYAEYPSNGTTLHGSTDIAIRERTGDEDELGLTWGDKVSMGIAVAAETIAWGLVKGAEAGTQIVHQGGVKLRSSLKPNETPTEVDENVQQKIRHVKTVAGMACQVSSTVVSAVAAMTRELARSIAPVVVEKGGKMLPESIKKKTDDEKGQKTVQNAVKVAVGGAQGLATVYEGLEKSWKLLYKSLQHATVQTVDHKYGSAVGEATDNSLGALGFALQTCWNVDNLGVKALAKRTVKDTGKEMICEAEKKYLPPADDQQRHMQQMNGHK